MQFLNTDLGPRDVEREWIFYVVLSSAVDTTDICSESSNFQFVEMMKRGLIT